MKTIAATPNLVEIGASQRGRDKGKKGATYDKSRDVRTEDAEIYNGIKDALDELEVDLRREIESLHLEIAK
ncbi:hypothetical protein PanWU01x14_095910, partial [Parasponia andersonii]